MTSTEQRSSLQDSSHPRRIPIVIPTIAGVEMWERFSFYGMQAIVVYYLYHSVTEGGLGIDQGQATALMGAYGSLVYLSCLAGGWIADRILGATRTLILGALILVVGHAALSLAPGISGVVIGLPAIAFGSGLLKTSAITVLGAALPVDDPRRDSGFQIFYLGINIGAFLGPLLTGWLAATYGFHVGFAAAAVLMVFGLVYYGLLHKKMLASLTPEAREAVTQPGSPAPTKTRVLVIACALAVIALLVVAMYTGVLVPTHLASLLLIVTLAAAALLFVQIFLSHQVTSAEKRTVTAFIPLFIASCAFWSIMNQTYGVFAVYSDQRLDRTIGSFTIPASWTQSFNPFYILVLSIPLAALWARLGKDKKAPSTFQKMSLGLAISGLGMMFMIPFAGGGENSTPVLVLAAAVLVITLGELLVGPVGMSAATAMSPQAFRTRFSGLYFLSMAIGSATAGAISPLYNPDNSSAERLYFFGCGAVAIIIALSTALLGRYLQKSNQKISETQPAS